VPWRAAEDVVLIGNETSSSKLAQSRRPVEVI
jgi:hypothetical protein